MGLHDLDVPRRLEGSSAARGAEDSHVLHQLQQLQKPPSSTLFLQIPIPPKPGTEGLKDPASRGSSAEICNS